jgi:hypothetical protein
MIVRLFIIPLLIAAAVLAIMIPIGRMAGGPASIDAAIEQLKKTTGGNRTADFLVGPGSKQRYIAAQTITAKMKEMAAKGMSEAERVKLGDQLLDVLENHTQAAEGEIQHFVLLALGRVWQVDPRQPVMDSPDALAARKKIIDALISTNASRNRAAYIDAMPIDSSKDARKAAEATRKAACLAIGYWAGRPEAKQTIPALIRKAKEDPEPDVRYAAITALGPIATKDDKEAVELLLWTMRNADRNHVEHVWAAAGSLAQMNVAEAKDVILMLLDRSQLKDLEYYDRESDPDNPRARKLGEEEQQRILINTMQCAVKLDVQEVNDKLKAIASSDPSPRVRAAAKELGIK